MTVATDHRPSDLLAYALFDLDPRVGSLREPLLTFLTSVVLFELERPAYREEIFAACEELFLAENGITLDQIEYAVATAKKAKLLVDSGEGKVYLSSTRRRQLAEAGRRIDVQRASFHEQIIRSVEKHLGEGLTDDDAAQLREALESFIHQLFQEHSVRLAKAFGPEGAGFDADTVTELDLQGLDRLARSIDRVTAKLKRAQVANGLKEGLFELDQEGQKFLAAVYQKTVAFALLRQDPSVQKVKRSLVEKRVFYLDTNVVMAYMFSDDPRHEYVRAAVDGATEVGCRVVVSSFTLAELEDRLERSQKRYMRLRGHPPQAFSIVDDVILRTYAAALEKAPGLQWGAFYGVYFPPAEYLKEFSIEGVDVDEPQAIHDDDRDRVREAVSLIKGPDAHPRVIERDANNLLLIQVRRRKIKADEMGRRVWLVTLDQSLRKIEQRLVANSIFEVPSTKQVGEWAADLSFHLPPDDVDLGEYVLHVLRSQLGLLAEDPIFANVNFLSILEESPFDIDELLSAKPSTARRALVELQKEREIKNLLAAEPDQPAERDVWADLLAKIFKETLDRLDTVTDHEVALDQTKAERDSAIHGMELAQRSLDDWTARIEALEQKMQREQQAREDREAEELEHEGPVSKYRRPRWRRITWWWR